MEKSDKSYFKVGQVPIGIGAQMRGWDVTDQHFRDPDTLPVVDFLAMTHACRHDCAHCFTNKIKKELTRDQIFSVIDQLAQWNTHAINFVGEGEPTLDKDFFPIIEHTSKKGIIPVIFTTSDTRRMHKKSFIRRIKDTGASISPKCDSLYNEKYQNWILQSDDNGHYYDYDTWQDKSAENMFQRRNTAVNMLIDEGFNDVTPEGTTRMGFDMLITKRNMHEVPDILKFCRDNNIWIVFAFYLPSGRSGMEGFDNSMALSSEERQTIRIMVQNIDRDEYKFDHPIFTNFITQPCVEFMQIHGNGTVNVCPGYNEVIGNVRKDTITTLVSKIWQKSPCRHPSYANGGCPPREAKFSI